MNPSNWRPDQKKYTLIAWACMISNLLRAAFLWFGCHSTSLIYMMQKKQKLIAWLILLCVIFIHIVYHFEIGMSEQRVFFFFFTRSILILFQMAISPSLSILILFYFNYYFFLICELLNYWRKDNGMRNMLVAIFAVVLELVWKCDSFYF